MNWASKAAIKKITIIKSCRLPVAKQKEQKPLTLLKPTLWGFFVRGEKNPTNGGLLISLSVYQSDIGL